MRRLIDDRRGATLAQLVAGMAVAALILIAVASVEISSWRYRRADEIAFAGQSEATTLLDRFAQDVRQATGVSLGAEGAPAVTLTVPGGPVTYQLNAQGDVLRQGRVLMHGAAALQFFREDSGRTLRAVVTAANGYRLQSKATRRLGP